MNDIQKRLILLIVVIGSGYLTLMLSSNYSSLFFGNPDEVIKALDIPSTLAFTIERHSDVNRSSSLSNKLETMDEKKERERQQRPIKLDSDYLNTIENLEDDVKNHPNSLPTNSQLLMNTDATSVLVTADDENQQQQQQQQQHHTAKHDNKTQQHNKSAKPLNSHLLTNENTTVTADDETQRTIENEQKTQQQQNKSSDKPLNIVLLYADDWRHDSLGIAGTLPVHTPFLDRLTKEGMRFTHNCVTTAVCWVSRATLHTGQYLSKHKSDAPRRPVFYEQWNSTFPYLLKAQNNYDVGHVGKWNFWNFPSVKRTYTYTKIYETNHWFPMPGGQIHVTQRNENDAMEFLTKVRNKTKPFMLTVAFFAPHAVDSKREQYFPQNQSMSLYKNITLRAPVDMVKEWKKLPGFFTESNEGRRRWHLRFDDPIKYDRMLKNYFRLVSEIDATCEKIYNELKAQGILDETLFIFTTDNGLYHGEHGLAGKWYPHEESIRVPLIIRDPRMPTSKRGTVDDSFTLNIDLYPTILGAAQASIPKDHKYDGRDIADIYLNRNGGKDTWRTQFYYEHPMHLQKSVIPESTALVRKDYKYFNWPREGNAHDTTIEQLFHVLIDKREEYDLANRAETASIMTEMRSTYQELKKQAAEL